MSTKQPIRPVLLGGSFYSSENAPLQGNPVRRYSPETFSEFIGFRTSLTLKTPRGVR
jgi:hypothetical protein